MKNVTKVTAALYFITAIIAAIFYVYYAVDAWVKEKRSQNEERKKFREEWRRYEDSKDFYVIKVEED